MMLFLPNSPNVKLPKCMVSTENKFNDISFDKFLPLELKDYLKNQFNSNGLNKITIKGDDEQIDAWTTYCLNAEKIGAMNVLKKCYPQLHFPIEMDINKSDKYLNAVLKGKFEPISTENNLQIKNLEEIKISIYESFAGKIPVIEIPEDQDFVKIVQCLLYKNNPKKIPSSMGALLINGINNWDRLNFLKENKNAIFKDVNMGFKEMITQNPGLFKDKIIVLSKKNYSNVPATKLNLNPSKWLSLSYIIRLEHECTHLYTLKNYGTASNNLHDELIADYIGISKALGVFDKDWMLMFLGLENFPNYRKGARLENYIANLNLASETFKNLTNIVFNAIKNIALFDAELGKIQSINDQKNRIDCLCITDLMDIAASNGKEILISNYKLIGK
jgi:hypothetical protein